METQRICTICQQPIPDGENGNRKVHRPCEKNRKDENNAARADKLRPMDNIALKLDKLLGNYYSLSGGYTAIDRNTLTRDGFRWDFIIAISSSKPPIFWILNYGYSYLNKTKIIIHNGTNPVRQLPAAPTNNEEI